jgi:hypothetical protein
MTLDRRSGNPSAVALTHVGWCWAWAPACLPYGSSRTMRLTAEPLKGTETHGDEFHRRAGSETTLWNDGTRASVRPATFTWGVRDSFTWSNAATPGAPQLILPPRPGGTATWRWPG